MTRASYKGKIRNLKASMAYLPDFGKVVARILSPGRQLAYSESMELNGQDSKTTFSVDDVQPAVQATDRVNLISSLVRSNPDIHYPGIDIDSSVFLVESQTPGHHHLYIDKALTYDEYERLLRTLLDVGLVEQGFYDSFILRKATYLRIPPANDY
jgi:hypothetical protein